VHNTVLQLPVKQ